MKYDSPLCACFKNKELNNWFYDEIVKIISDEFNLNYFNSFIQFLNINTGISSYFHYKNMDDLKFDYWLLQKFIKIIKKL